MNKFLLNVSAGEEESTISFTLKDSNCIFDFAEVPMDNETLSLELQIDGVSVLLLPNGKYEIL